MKKCLSFLCALWLAALTACTAPAEPAASSAAEAAPEVSGAYRLSYADPGEDAPTGMRLELLQKGDRLGLLFTTVYDTYECTFRTYTVPAAPDESGAVHVVYDGESEHIELACDGRTAEVTFLWEGERDAASGTYARIENAEAPSRLPTIPQPENDPHTPDGAIDTILAAAARRDLEYPDTAVLSKADCACVRSLQVFEDRLTSLNGIEYFVNLETIDVNTSYLTDITPLTKLTKLQFVSISWSYITQIPDFSGCPDLEFLSLVCCRITDLSPAANIPSLRNLQLSDNAITSVAPLANVQGLETLNLNGNPVLDWETIADNASLRAAIDLNFDTILATMARARAIVAETVTPAMTDLEKEIALCRKIHAIADYQECQRPQRPYGYEVLVNGRGVCGDFGEATCLLMNLAGLPCVDLNSDTHAWNAVQIDGVWYELDCLWDDGVQPVFWQYFNLSHDKMSRDPDHVSDANRFPLAQTSMPRLEYLMQISDPHESD